jgi:pyruvate formate lyase activating enzyme
MCRIPQGKAGICRVRENRGGKLALPYYGFITALAIDPIEKKPLYHFRPGSSILSAGFAGCNLRCPFCQNWRISQKTDADGQTVTPGELIARVPPESRAAAYTYSEPLVHAEYLLDCMALAREKGIANVLVTNGCVNAGRAGEILALTDAVNIDLKCFSARTYKNVLGGSLDAVLDFITLAAGTGVHTEITTLVVPGLNDGAGELDGIAAFIAGLKGREIPWHLSAYHPDYLWDAPPTERTALARASARAKKTLRYVYSGNTAGEANDTLCPACGAALIKRRGYSIDTAGLELKRQNGKTLYRCASCKARSPIVW